MQVTLWTNKRNEACATVWDKAIAQFSITFQIVEQRDKFIKKNKLTIV